MTVCFNCASIRIAQAGLAAPFVLTFQPVSLSCLYTVSPLSLSADPSLSATGPAVCVCGTVVMACRGAADLPSPSLSLFLTHVITPFVGHLQYGFRFFSQATQFIVTRYCVSVRPNHSGLTAWLQGQRYPCAEWTTEFSEYSLTFQFGNVFLSASNCM